MRKRTKWILGSVVCLAVLGLIGYKWAISYASDRLVEQVTKDMFTDDEVNELMKEPAIQKALEEQLGAVKSPTDLATDSAGASQEAGQSSPDTPAPSGSKDGSGGSTSASTVEKQGQHPFSDKEEALKFLLTRFSMSELKEFVSMASGGVTAEEKKEIKEALLGRLSPEEFQALKVLGLIELKKRQQEQQ